MTRIELQKQLVNLETIVSPDAWRLAFMDAVANILLDAQLFIHTKDFYGAKILREGESFSADETALLLMKCKGVLSVEKGTCERNDRDDESYVSFHLSNNAHGSFHEYRGTVAFSLNNAQGLDIHSLRENYFQARPATWKTSFPEFISLLEAIECFFGKYTVACQARVNMRIGVLQSKKLTSNIRIATILEEPSISKTMRDLGKKAGIQLSQYERRNRVEQYVLRKA